MVLTDVCKFEGYNCQKIEIIWTVKRMDAFAAFSGAGEGGSPAVPKGEAA